VEISGSCGSSKITFVLSIDLVTITGEMLQCYKAIKLNLETLTSNNFVKTFNFVDIFYVSDVKVCLYVLNQSKFYKQTFVLLLFFKNYNSINCISISIDKWRRDYYFFSTKQ
jgi:hypothetical protein